MQTRVGSWGELKTPDHHIWLESEVKNNIFTKTVNSFFYLLNPFWKTDSVRMHRFGWEKTSIFLGFTVYEVETRMFFQSKTMHPYEIDILERERMEK